MLHSITGALPPPSLRTCADARYPLIIGSAALQLSDTNWKQKQQQKVVGVGWEIIYLVAEKDVRVRVRACACVSLSPPQPPPTRLLYLNILTKVPYSWPYYQLEIKNESIGIMFKCGMEGVVGEGSRIGMCEPTYTTHRTQCDNNKYCIQIVHGA